MKKSMKCLLFCLFAAMSVLAAAQTPIPLTGGGVGDPDPLSGGHNKAPMQTPSLFIDGNELFLAENYSAEVYIYAADDHSLSDPLYETSINEGEHSTLLPPHLYGAYIIRIQVYDRSFIGMIYIE